MVVPVDPAYGRVFDVGDGLGRAVMEDRRAHAFGLVEPVDRLHQGVVIRVADRADRGRDLLEREVICQHNRRVLRPGIRVMDELPGADGATLPVTFPQRHPQRDQVKPREVV